MSELIKTVNNESVGTSHEKVGKRNADFSAVETMARWAGNPDWVDGYRAISDENVKENDYTTLWKAMKTSSEDVFNELYGSIINLSDNIANLDLCTVAALKDKVKELGMEERGVIKIDVNFPVEISKMVDLFSINKAHLKGALTKENGSQKWKYGKTTFASEELWQILSDECTDDERYRKFIRNTFYSTLESFVNLKTADGTYVIWQTAPRRFSEDLFSSRIEYANPTEATYGTVSDTSSNDRDKEIFSRKLQLGVPRSFSEKYYADEILIGNRTLDEFDDAEQEIINMEVSRRMALWENSGVNYYTSIREIKVLNYVRFVTLFANAIYDTTDYDIDKRKTEILGLDESKYLIKGNSGTYVVDETLLGTVADTLTDYCIDISYFRESVRTEAQRNMLKGTKTLLIDTIREALAKNVYSTYGGYENFWRQTNTSNVIGLGVEIPSDLDIKVIEYIDNTRYTNIRAKEDDDLTQVNQRYWQISGVQGDLDPGDVLDFYNRLTDYKDPWHIFECAKDTDDQNDPKVNLWRFLNYVYNSGAFSATLSDLEFDTETVAERIAPTLSDIYGYDEIVALLDGASTSAEVPGRLPKVYFDYQSAATSLVEAFADISLGDPTYKTDGTGDYTDDYAALYNRYHDYDTICNLISSYKTPDEFLAAAQSIFPSAYFDTIKAYDYLYGKIVYQDDDLSSAQIVTIIDSDGNVSSTSSFQSTTISNLSQVSTTISGGYTTIVTVSGNSVNTLPEKPYIALTGFENSFDTAWDVLLSHPEYQTPDRLHEVFYYVSEYPSLSAEVFGDASNYRHESAIETIQTLGDDFNYDAVDIIAASSTYVGTMIHETGTFGDALYNHIGDITYGIRPFANSQNTVHPSVQVHAFLSALSEYVDSSHAIVRYLNVNQPKFETYCQTVIDRIDKLGNTVNYWKNNVDDFSGYTTDYEKNGEDTDRNNSIDGPFNMDALQSLMDDKIAYIEGIKNETNEYYVSGSRGAFSLTDDEKQTEIDNITLYYDQICRLATKEIARYGRDKYGNAYILYKDKGERTNRDRLGYLWIRKADRPLAFPGLVVDELTGTLSNNSQIASTDNSTIESKIVEQFKYPQKTYGDVNLVGCYLKFVYGSETASAKCAKIDWALLASKTSREFVDECRGTDGYHPVDDDDGIVIKYFTNDSDGSVVESGQGAKIWDAGLEEPRYLNSSDDEFDYEDDVIVGDYAEGDLAFNMVNYETHDYKRDMSFEYTVDSGRYSDGDDGVRELTFVVYKDDANSAGTANNYFLDGADGQQSVTFHNLHVYGIYVVRLPRVSGDTNDDLSRVVSMELVDGNVGNTMSRTLKLTFCDLGGSSKLVGNVYLSGDDTNGINIEFGDADANGLTTATGTVVSNGQNIGRYYDFAMNETQDVIVLSCKDPHYDTYAKSWAVDAMVNQANNLDGSSEIQLYKDSLHNVEYVKCTDRVATDGSSRSVMMHCGDVYVGETVHSVFATVKEVSTVNGDGTSETTPTADVAFRCCSFGCGTYRESTFVPAAKYAPVKINGKYHFRVNASGEKVYVAYCTSLPDDDDRVGNYVNGYDGLVAGSTSFRRCADLVKSNGVTVVGFDAEDGGLKFADDIRYVLPNETLGYYPQYSGLVGRNMTYANPSMVGRDLFGFELMFDHVDGGETSIIAHYEKTFNGSVTVDSIAEYDGSLFVQYRDESGADKTAFVTRGKRLIDVDLGDGSYYAIGFTYDMVDGAVVKNGGYAISFGPNIVGREFGYKSGATDYYDCRPTISVATKDGVTKDRLEVVLEDFELDEDGNKVSSEFSAIIKNVSNVDSYGNFIVVCTNNTIAACRLDLDSKTVAIKSVKRFDLTDGLSEVVNTFDGKFVVYPRNLNSGSIAFVHASANTSGNLDVGYYKTEYADSAKIRDVAIFNDSVFVVFDGTHVDHIFKVDNCFVDSGSATESFVMIDGADSGYSSFVCDDDHLFIIPATLDDTILVFDPQTDDFEDAYELYRLVGSTMTSRQVLVSRIVDDNLYLTTCQPTATGVPSYQDVTFDIGSDVNYAILELDKGFPILVTYTLTDTKDVSMGYNWGATEGDNVTIHFKCLFNTNSFGRDKDYKINSWSRDTISFSYCKATEVGKEFDALTTYGTNDNQYVYGDARLYKVTATGGRKFYIERLYRSGDYATGEFDEGAYLSFTYDLDGYTSARRNKMFAHLNSQTFRYTVSGPFTDLGYELGTQYDVEPTSEEIAEKFRGMSISRSFDTYWLSGEIYHLSSVVEPSSYEYRDLDCLTDSNLAFARNTIICSCESMFDGHRNLLCEGRTLDVNGDDNSKHIRSARNMFRGDVKLVLPEVSITDSNILDTASMFEDCGVAILNGAAFPQSLTSVERMFCNCETSTFSWEMIMPGTVVRSLSSVFYNCVNGTFDGFLFGAFPRYRVIEREGTLREIVTVTDPYFDLIGNSTEAPSGTPGNHDAFRNLNETFYEPVLVGDNNPDSGRFFETVATDTLSGDSMESIDSERFLSFDMDDPSEATRPLLNFGGEPLYEYITHADELSAYCGRFANTVQNDLIGDYMFWNTPRFIADDISFGNVSHTLCSTISMFERCATVPSDIDEDYDASTNMWRRPNPEAGRLVSETDEWSDMFTERFFSFDMDENDSEPLLNFEREYSYSLGSGYHTFDGLVELPNLVDGRRMFKDSAFRFYDTTVRLGRRIQNVSEMFRRCACIAGLGPMISTYDFHGYGKRVGDVLTLFGVPSDARGLYAGCVRMTSVDITSLGDIVNNGLTADEIRSLDIRHDFLLADCPKLEVVTGKINPLLSSARGLFKNCPKLGPSVVESFLRKMSTTCDITGMFYGCPYVATAYTADEIMERLGGSDLVTGDPFADPGELAEEL